MPINKLCKKKNGPIAYDKIELSQVEQKSIVIPGHEALTLGSQLTWKEASKNTYAQFNWSPDDEFALDFPKSGFFEMRIALAEQQTPQLFDMSIQFVGIGNEISAPLKISHYLTLYGPAAGHSLLQTPRISVKEVKGITKMKAIRFVFDGTTYGKIIILFSC